MLKQTEPIPSEGTPSTECLGSNLSSDGQIARTPSEPTGSGGDRVRGGMLRCITPPQTCILSNCDSSSTCTSTFLTPLFACSSLLDLGGGASPRAAHRQRPGWDERILPRRASVVVTAPTPNRPSSPFASQVREGRGQAQPLSTTSSSLCSPSATWGPQKDPGRTVGDRSLLLCPPSGGCRRNCSKSL